MRALLSMSRFSRWGAGFAFLGFITACVVLWRVNLSLRQEIGGFDGLDLIRMRFLIIFIIIWINVYIKGIYVS